jgi:hypothetical protein
MIFGGLLSKRTPCGASGKASLLAKPSKASGGKSFE